MCRAVKCRTCGKTTWSGCGSHVAQVRASVPSDEWCDGHPRTDDGSRSWLSRFFGPGGPR
ncbi:hypothetical protein [Marmoricola sp. RAF53]|uniref:hypothetical protein n=1 Tax=Marmoricola sp. RAF53 TaxID=3233059 RepID=UPI003F99995A